MGVVLYALLTGALPFDESNIPTLYQKIREAKFIKPVYLSAAAKDLIVRMMRPKPLERATIAEIKNHPWYSYSLPLYIQLMDNAKSEIQKDVNKEVFAFLCKIKEYGITKENVEQVKKDILEGKPYSYCVAYNLLNDQLERAKYISLNHGKTLIKRVGDRQHIFSAENIFSMYERKTTHTIPLLPSGTITKSPTMSTLSDSFKPTASDIDIESKVPVNHWVVGVQVECYPHTLLMSVLGCLQAMGFVLWGVMVEVAVCCAKVQSALP
eukprot:TRINITY_DN1392_c0_g1_i7.p1 TRINITY_DN1392_c0_g1~~TRINITY_DN1392_c0_g1_i7.p1  ORF type:complete len:267 (+),score=52.25 TRINITY_DN1392_c0_g1_i7:751-1551(+)